MTNTRPVITDHTPAGEPREVTVPEWLLARIEKANQPFSKYQPCHTGGWFDSEYGVSDKVIRHVAVGEALAALREIDPQLRVDWYERTRVFEVCLAINNQPVYTGDTELLAILAACEAVGVQ